MQADGKQGHGAAAQVVRYGQLDKGIAGGKHRGRGKTNHEQDQACWHTLRAQGCYTNSFALQKIHNRNISSIFYRNLFHF